CAYRLDTVAGYGHFVRSTWCHRVAARQSSDGGGAWLGGRWYTRRAIPSLSRRACQEVIRGKSRGDDAAYVRRRCYCLFVADATLHATIAALAERATGLASADTADALHVGYLLQPAGQVDDRPCCKNVGAVHLS